MMKKWIPTRKRRLNSIENLIGVLMVLGAILGLAGCASATAPERAGTAGGGSTASGKEYTADVAIIGAGWAGLNAGVCAGEAGLTTVILEKNGVIGGGGHFLIGTTAVGSPLSERTVDQAYRDYMEFTHQVPDGLLVRTLINEVPNNVTWFQAHGIEQLPGGLLKNGGADAVGILSGLLAKMDKVTILTETPATDLIIENGAVTGVIAQSGGGPIRVKAKYVIIATGPIVDSPEMVKKYIPWFGEGYRLIGMPGRTGDGITLALQAGAKIDPLIGADVETGWTMGLPPAFYYTQLAQDTELMILHDLVKFPVLRINKRGDRFMDESIGPFHQETHAIARNGNVYWALYDASLVEGLKIEGYDALGFPQIMFATPPDPKFTAIDRALDRALQAGYAVKSDTLEGLAQQLGVEPRILQGTVARYNGFARAGQDDDFLKDPKYLHSYDQGPFYAVKGVSTLISSNGGIQCDTTFNVIDTDLNPIPGLYVAGVMVGSRQGDTYPQKAQDLLLGGSSSGFGAAAARVIIQNAAKALRGN